MESIKFEYEGKAYSLCFTRDSARQIEAQGFSVTDIDSKPSIMVPILWRGAFLANHKGVKRKLIDEIWERIKSQDLILALVELYSNTLNDLIEGDVEEDDPNRIAWVKE